MTEKETAEKVWGLLDKQLLSASRTFDVTRTVYRKGSRDYLATTMDELEKILPRPKRKVKKIEKRWVVSYWSKEYQRVFERGSPFDKEEEARSYLGEGETLTEIEISAEVWE